MSIKQSILDKARRGKPKCYEQKRKQVLTRKAITRNKMKFAESYREEKVTLNKKKESSEGWNTTFEKYGKKSITNRVIRTGSNRKEISPHIR